MILLFFLLHLYVLHVILHFVMHHVMEALSHSALVSCTHVLEPKGHHRVIEVTYGCSESSLLCILRCYLDLVVPLNPSMKENIACPVVEFISRSMFGKGNSSLRWARLRFLKSTQYLICLFFFLTGTILDNHLGCWVDLMNPATSSFCTL